MIIQTYVYVYVRCAETGNIYCIIVFYELVFWLLEQHSNIFLIGKDSTDLSKPAEKGERVMELRSLN